MIKIHKMTNGIKIYLDDHLDTMDKSTALKLCKVIRRNIEAGRLIYVNLNLVDDITSDAYELLGEIKTKAIAANCLVRFNHYGTDILTKEKIDTVPFI